MVKFYVTNQFVDMNKKLITADQTIIVSEERAENLTKKNFGYVVGKAELPAKNEKSSFSKNK